MNRVYVCMCVCMWIYPQSSTSFNSRFYFTVQCRADIAIAHKMTDILFFFSNRLFFFFAFFRFCFLSILIWREFFINIILPLCVLYSSDVFFSLLTSFLFCFSFVVIAVHGTLFLMRPRLGANESSTNSAPPNNKRVSSSGFSNTKNMCIFTSLFLFRSSSLSFFELLIIEWWLFFTRM